MNKQNGPLISIGHGSGGRLTQALIRDTFLREFKHPALAAMGDAAALSAIEGDLAFTTDGFVVSPLFFPGGDIGKLAVCGTVNDLAVTGAVPLFLSAAFILEEGLPVADLECIVHSMARAAEDAGVHIVTGDTKVVERGHGDGVFITTSGVGRIRKEAAAGATIAQVGDAVLVSGPIGDHGAVIGAHRSGLELAELQSDCGPISDCVESLYAAGVEPRFMRDPTRGGLVTVLAEFSHEAGGLSVVLRQDDLPIRDSVKTVCEILGLDPLYLACEGRVVVVVPTGQAERALAALRSTRGGTDACVVGEVAAPEPSPVVLATRYGGTRLYDMLASEPLPRIC